MTVLEAVNKAKDCLVRVQVTSNGYTQFLASDEKENALLLGRTKSIPVENIKTECENETPIIHIYGMNYLNYQN